MSLRSIAAACALTLAPIAAAQTRAEKYPALGVAIEVPRKYTAIPVQPTEPWIVLHYSGADRDPAELLLLRFDRKPDPIPAPDPLPITSFERYVEQRLPQWNVEARAVEPAAGWSRCEYVLAPKSGLGGVFLWGYGWQNPERAWVLLGICSPRDAEKNARVWLECAKDLELSAPVEHPQLDAWRKQYARKPELEDPEYRIQIRSGLVRGWEAEDTPHYLLLFSTKKETLIRDLSQRLEAIREAYLARFPPASPITAVSTVRICKDAAEYLDYGGPDNTAGYWNPAGKELVLFAFENTRSNVNASKENSRLVLYHEAFHQYIYYSVGEIAPHMWFNEGYGDYFAGAVIDRHGEVAKIGVNPWRVASIRYRLGDPVRPSLFELLNMERTDFYSADARTTALHYAMAWSVIYFLEESKDVRKNPAWGRILPTYFETLKDSNARERLAAGDSDPDATVLSKVRKEALDAALLGIDLRALESAWFDFVLHLEVD